MREDIKKTREEDISTDISKKTVAIFLMVAIIVSVSLTFVLLKQLGVKPVEKQDIPSINHNAEISLNVIAPLEPVGAEISLNVIEPEVE